MSKKMIEIQVQADHLASLAKIGKPPRSGLIERDGSLTLARGWPPASLPTSGKGETEPRQQFRKRQRASRGFPPSGVVGFLVRCRRIVGQMRQILQSRPLFRHAWPR